MRLDQAWNKPTPARAASPARLLAGRLTGLRGQRLALAGLLALVLGLAGCFDYELHLKLLEDGGGALAAQVTMPQADERLVGPGRLNLILLPDPQLGREEKGGQLLLSEMVEFKRLDRLVLKGARFQVERLKEGLLNLAAGTFRLTARIYPTPDEIKSRRVLPHEEAETARRRIAMHERPEEAKARELVVTALKGHFLTLKLDVPGEVKVARPMVVGDLEVYPEMAHDGSRVVWRVPLAGLVNTRAEVPLVFTLDFEGHFPREEVSTRGPEEIHDAEKDQEKEDKPWPKDGGMPSDRNK
ncbi:MAG: hypothetical protein KQJ78_05765 [Deltaproteobacteria bacterium]|nr:hypothetical protein [Deltaproteobacteria bacterium]